MIRVEFNIASKETKFVLDKAHPKRILLNRCWRATELLNLDACAALLTRMC